VAAINIFGLALGLCAVYFAFLYITFETSYDNFNRKSDRIYRLVTDVYTSTGTNYESASAAMAPGLQRQFPQVESSTRVFLDDYIFLVNGKNFGTVQLAYADSTLFDIFDFPLIAGNKEKVLRDPFSAVISRSAAGKYFGSLDCIGKTIMLNGNLPAKVTGIMKEIPVNSHLRRDVFLSMSTLLTSDRQYLMSDWNRYGFYTYLLLKHAGDTAQIANNLQSFIARNSSAKTVRQHLTLEPLGEVYMHGKPRGSKAGSTTHGNENNLYVFTVVAIIVLLIACFNFVNLTTAFSVYRAREISVRKILGAGKKQLVIQFLTDAIAISVVAFVLAMILSQLLMPFFNALNGKEIARSIFNSGYLVIVLLGISLAAGILSGIYPAFVLSSYPAVKSSVFLIGAKFNFLRKALVVIQFSFSISLIFALIVVERQLHFMQNEELGFSKQHLLVIDFQFSDDIKFHTDKMKSTLREIPGIESLAFSSNVPGRENKKYPLSIANRTLESQELQADVYFVDNDFFSQYQVELIAGTLFPANDSMGYFSMVVNEAMATSLGYTNPGELIGKKYSQRFANTTQEGEIIGVVKDFHYRSYDQRIEPLAIRRTPVFFTFLSVSVAANDLSSTIGSIEKKWKSLAPGLPLSYFFADEAFDAQYRAEERFKTLFIWLAGLAMAISCLGILGLSIHSTERRAKEISIRKVLGASLWSVLVTLTKEMFLLITLSFIVAVPIGWVTLNEWLNSYSYRIAIGWWMFLIAGGAALTIAFITVSVHSIKCALANPMKSLNVPS
jgi:putative ABC transport system permease protein